MAMASPSVAEAFFFEELQATAGHREAAWLSSGAYCPRRGRSCSCRSLRATRGLNERGVAMGRAPPPPRRGVALGSVRRNLRRELLNLTSITRMVTRITRIFSALTWFVPFTSHRNHAHG